MSETMQTAPDAKKGGGLFRNPFIRAIIASALFLQIGIWVRNFAILLFVTEKTNNDPVAVSLISVAEFVPIFLFSFIGGTFADRWRPKRTMIWCDILSALSVLAVLFTLHFGSWEAVFFVTLISAILSQFHQPSGMKLFKQHVPEEQMGPGMAIYQTLAAVFLILGPALGTVVYTNFGIEISIAITAVMFVLSAFALVFMPKDREETQAPTSTVWTEMKDGVRYVMDRAMLKILGGGFLTAGLAVGLVQPLGIFLVMEQLGHPKEDLQYIMMVSGVAMLIGGVLTMQLSRKFSAPLLLIIGMAASSVAMVGTAFSTLFWLTLVLQFVSGLFFPCIQVGIQTMILKATDEAFIGRVNGVLTPLFLGMVVVTMSLSGVLKDSIGLVPMYLASGALFLIGSFVLVPLVRMFKSVETNNTTSAPTQTQLH